MKHLTAEQVLFIHSKLIDKTGGSHGIRDLGLLQSGVLRAKTTFGGKEFYPDVFHKAAAALLIESLIKSRPFIDGNKRTAITSAGIFLKRNGYALKTTQKELERFTLNMANGKVSTLDAVKWFKRHSSKNK